MGLVKNKNAGQVKITKGEAVRKPYPHQIEAMKALSSEVENKEDYKGLLVLPTGGGKTLTAVQWILKNVINNKNKVLWIAHRHELLDQALKSFIDNSYSNLVLNRSFYNYRIISGKHDRPVNIKSYDDIIIASKDSLGSGIKYLIKNWVKASKEDIFIVVDEAHHAVAKGYVKILKEVEKEAKGKVRIVGLTATPFRTSEDEKGSLKKIFKDDITYGIDLRKLINTEILSQPIFIEEKTKVDMSLDLSEKQLNFIKNSDVIPEDIAKFIAENKDRNRFIVEHYIKNKDKYGKTIVFAVNQMNAIALKSIFEKYGVKSDYVISGLKSGGTLVSISNEEKDRIIKDFKDGKLDVLINVNILTEGTDIPNTQTVFLARQTTSSILMTQMIGRALRGKKAGGTDKAYVVSFVDDWKNKISWVNPKILIESNYNDDINDPKERNKNIVRLIALNKIEEFAKIIDNTVNTEGLENLPFIERIPVGIYSFSILLNNTEDEHNEKICDILVYDCFKNELENFINNLDDIFKECNVEEKEYLSDKEVNRLCNLAKDKYLKGSDTSISCNEDDIKDIIIYYSQTGEKPKFMPLEEREKFDISKIAKEIYDKDLGERAKLKYINELWEDENNFLKLFFNGDKRLLYDMVNKEISKISFDSEEECVDSIEVNYEDVDERKLDLNKLAEENPAKARELREAVFNKFKDKDGYYHSAISDYKSKSKLNFQIDHIIPISEGGLTELGNLQLLTRWENMNKSNSLNYDIEEKDINDMFDEIIEESPKEAIEFSKGIIEKSEKPNIYLNLGDAYLANEDYEKAIESVSKGFEKGAHNKIYGNNIIGGTYYCLNDNEKSKKYFGKVLDEDNDNPYALSYIGDIYEEEEQYNDSLEIFRKILEIESVDEYMKLYSLIKIGYLYLEHLNKPRLAFRSFKEAINLNKDNFRGYLGLAMYYKKNENHKKSLEYLKLAEEREDNNPFIYVKIAEAYKELKEYKYVEEYLKMAEAIDDKDIDVLEGLAYEMQRKRRYELSIEYFKKAIEINNEDDFLWNDMGISYERNKDCKKALECYKKAYKLNPDEKLYSNNIRKISKKMH